MQDLLVQKFWKPCASASICTCDLLQQFVFGQCVRTLKNVGSVWDRAPPDLAGQLTLLPGPMTATPAGLRNYQDSDRVGCVKASVSQIHKAQVTNPAVQRLRAKLDKGSIRYRRCELSWPPKTFFVCFHDATRRPATVFCCSATEKNILRTLEKQSAAQAQMAAKAKMAMNKAAHEDSVPLTSTQIKAR